MNKIKQLIIRWVNKEPAERDRSKLQQRAVKALIGFFVFIILLTVLSRATQTFTIPSVRITNLSDGNLTFSITGEGSLTARTVKYLELPEGIRVSSVFVSPGSYVDEETPLLILDPEDISRKISETEEELQRIAIQMDIEKLSTDGKKLMDLKLQNLQLDFDAIEEKVNTLQELLLVNGTIISPYIGRINTIDAVQGERITSGAEIEYGISGYLLCGSVSEGNGEYLDIGDEVIASRVGKNDKYTAIIQNLAISNIGTVDFLAQLDDSERFTTDALTFSIQKVSSKYKNCVPLSALRQDSKSTFLYILEEADSLLGKEYHAKRVDVTIADRDNSLAALKECPVNYGDSIIIYSNKIIGDGDKVRIGD